MKMKKIVTIVFLVVLGVSLLTGYSVGTLLSTPAERYEDAEVWIDSKLLPGVKINLFVQQLIEISPDVPTRIVHGWDTSPAHWSEMTAYQKTEFLSTTDFRFFFKGEEIPLTRIQRYDKDTDYMYTLLYRVFPPGYFPVGQHQIRGEWYRLLDGTWEAFARDGTLWIHSGGKDFTTDSDGDGLTDGEEKMNWGTNYLDPDTDGDELSDGDEITLHGTDATSVDSDGDSINDCDEVINLGTDPWNPDTDGDGLTDPEEVDDYGTDPLLYDSDWDSLFDYDEVKIFQTDPLNVDTDGDGLWDFDEIYFYSTNPLDSDTDADGLTDGDEVNPYGTVPHNPDSDGDGFTDGDEVSGGTDPLDPNDPPISIITVGSPITPDASLWFYIFANYAPVDSVSLSDTSPIPVEWRFSGSYAFGEPSYFNYTYDPTTGNLTATITNVLGSWNITSYMGSTRAGNWNILEIYIQNQPNWPHEIILENVFLNGHSLGNFESTIMDKR